VCCPPHGHGPPEAVAQGPRLAGDDGVMQLEESRSNAVLGMLGDLAVRAGEGSWGQPGALWMFSQNILGHDPGGEPVNAMQVQKLPLSQSLPVTGDRVQLHEALAILVAGLAEDPRARRDIRGRLATTQGELAIAAVVAETGSGGVVWCSPAREHGEVRESRLVLAVDIEGAAYRVQLERDGTQARESSPGLKFGDSTHRPILKLLWMIIKYLS
jgi:hypothetical protein